MVKVDIQGDARPDDDRGVQDGACFRCGPRATSIRNGGGERGGSGSRSFSRRSGEGQVTPELATPYGLSTSRPRSRASRRSASSSPRTG